MGDALPLSWRRSQEVKARDFDSRTASSSLAAAARHIDAICSPRYIDGSERREVAGHEPPRCGYMEEEMGNRESVVIYRSFIEAIGALPDEYRTQAYDALFALALDGKGYEGDNPVIKAVMLLVAPQIEANNKRYENGKKGAEYGKLGGRPKKENPTETPNKPQENPTETPNVNVNDNVNVNVNDNDIKETPKPPKGGKRFTPPSLEEISAYCKERGNGIDPEAFYNFYASKNWNVGKTKMADWRACVRTWEIRRREERTGNVTPFKRKDEGRYGPNGVRIDNIDENDGLGEILR